MSRVVILDRGYKSYGYEKKLLNTHNHELDIIDDTNASMKKKMDFAKGAAGIFIRQTKIDAPFLDTLPGLKVIIRYGIGIDNIDLLECSKRGIKVANVQGYATHSVSDHAIALMYSCIRALPEGRRVILSDYGKPPSENIFELHDKILGVIGLGRIGSMFCQKTSPLFHKIMAVDPYVDNSKFLGLNVIPTSLENILRECHVISLHCSLIAETREMINRSAFAKMQNKPVIINTSRGKVINEMDLLEALNQDIVHSAGLDVWSEEPPSGNQKMLIDHPKVISTGHYAWHSDQASEDLQKRAAHNMVNLLKGEQIEDQLN